MICTNCPRECNVDRINKLGFCQMPNNIHLAKACLHYWEEPLISGEKGSGTIFFSGCTLKCVYCQNFEVSIGFGKEISVNKLCQIMKDLELKGANNINLVTPTPYVHKIIEALDKYKPNIPIVYNTSGYESIKTLEKLKDYVDIFLPDFKYSDNILSTKYSNCKNYYEITTNAILKMRELVGKDIIENGLMKKGLIVRHLVLPNNINNTLGVIEWLNNNMSKDTYISLMGQFVPYGDSKNIKELSRKIKPLEYKIAINKMQELGFTNVFVQDLESASINYIPEFNLDF